MTIEDQAKSSIAVRQLAADVVIDLPAQYARLAEELFAPKTETPCHVVWRHAAYSEDTFRTNHYERVCLRALGHPGVHVGTNNGLRWGEVFEWPKLEERVTQS